MQHKPGLLLPSDADDEGIHEFPFVSCDSDIACNMCSFGAPGELMEQIDMSAHQIDSLHLHCVSPNDAEHTKPHSYLCAEVNRPSTLQSPRDVACETSGCEADTEGVCCNTELESSDIRILFGIHSINVQT
jgi:hypothetical protein